MTSDRVRRVHQRLEVLVAALELDDLLPVGHVVPDADVVRDPSRRVPERHDGQLVGGRRPVAAAGFDQDAPPPPDAAIVADLVRQRAGSVFGRRRRLALRPRIAFRSRPVIRSHDGLTWRIGFPVRRRVRHDDPALEALEHPARERVPLPEDEHLQHAGRGASGSAPRESPASSTSSAPPSRATAARSGVVATTTTRGVSPPAARRRRDRPRARAWSSPKTRTRSGRTVSSAGRVSRIPFASTRTPIRQQAARG